jgi:cytochrome c551
LSATSASALSPRRVAGAFGVCLLGCAGLIAALSGLQAGTAAGHAGAAKVTVVNVTAGKPSEFHFKLSKVSLITPGVVTFKFTNAGALPHNFKICTRAVTSLKANACNGKSTQTIQKGKTAILTIKLAKGQYEFLCTVPGHASAGMKGLVGIGVKVSGTPGASTTTTTTTTSTAGTEPLMGDPVAGAAVFAANGCATCHTLAAAGANGNVGPNLDLAKPTQAIVRLFVTNGGGGVMPPFSLSPTDLNNLAAYVYKSTH